MMVHAARLCMHSMACRKTKGDPARLFRHGPVEQLEQSRVIEWTTTGILRWPTVVSSGRGQVFAMSSGAYSPLRVDY